MGFELTVLNPHILQKQAVDEIIKCNALTESHGLILSHAQAQELVETRSQALKATGRIEFGGGAIDKIINEFYDSPYISKDNYTQTLHELIEMFYYYKNETIDLISDVDLIKTMKSAFDGDCHGSLDLLSGRELFRLARNLRFGFPAGYDENDTSGNVGDDHE